MNVSAIRPYTIHNSIILKNFIIILYKLEDSDQEFSMYSGIQYQDDNLFGLYFYGFVQLLMLINSLDSSLSVFYLTFPSFRLL